MSYQLPEKSPTPSPSAFLRGLVRELDAMHGSGIGHGGVAGDFKAWFSENAEFAPEKFRTFGMNMQSDTALLAVDVADFMKCARQWIGGSSLLDHSAFKAVNYPDANLPHSFLKLLEITDDANAAAPTMSDFLLTLVEEPNLPPISSEPVIPPAEKIVPAPLPNPAVASSLISIALPNGTVGKPYTIEPGKISSAIAAQRKDDPDRAKIVHLQVPENCGLIFDVTNGTITGTPTRSLDEQLYLDYVPSQHSPSVSCKVSLFINPDPASLWKDLDSDPNAPYQKSALDHSEHALGHFRIVAASRRGRSHANKGDFRDDDYAVGYSESSGWLVVAVADGAGSAKYSRKGSLIASTVARDWLVNSLDSPDYANWENSSSSEGGGKTLRDIRDLLYNAALLAHYKIKEEVEKPTETLPEPPVIRNYDTTLILLLLKKMAKGYFAATFSVGDGGAGLFLEPNQAVPLMNADGGEHAGQTTFLTIVSSLNASEENLTHRFSQATVSDFTLALAMTDGITDPKFPSDAAFADPNCWHALSNELKPALVDSTSLLEWLNFFSPGNHDDRTIVAVLPANQSPLV